MWLASSAGRQDLGLVDVVDLERLEHLRLGEVADARLGHHGDRHGLLDAADHLGSDMRATPPSRRMSAGTRSSAMTADGAGVLGDLGLLGRDHVHDHAALEHLGKAGLDAECRLVAHVLEFSASTGRRSGG